MVEKEPQYKPIPRKEIELIAYRINILDVLKDKGYTTYKLRKDKILGESTIQSLRNNKGYISFSALDTICKLLDLQPADIIAYVPDPEE